MFIWFLGNLFIQHTFYLGCNRKPIDKTKERAIEAAENKYIETLSGFKIVFKFFFLCQSLPVSQNEFFWWSKFVWRLAVFAFWLVLEVVLLETVGSGDEQTGSIIQSSAWFLCTSYCRGRHQKTCHSSNNSNNNQLELRVHGRETAWVRSDDQNFYNFRRWPQKTKKIKIV